MIEKRAQALKVPDFDITTKGTSSPSKNARNYTKVVGADLELKPSGKYDNEELIPPGYEEHLMK